MIRPGQALRLFYIGWVLLRHGVWEVVFAVPVLRPLRFLVWFSPFYWTHTRGVPQAERIRSALEDLGPLFVKFGQMLSTRRDLLPDDIALELARLQDRVPPFPGAEARRLIEREYGQSVGTLFAAFDEQPLASASIAQVHAAALHDGRRVIVKVVRPGIERTIRRDIALLYILAHNLERYSSEARRLRPVEVVAEYEKTILDELDMQREAANAAQLRRNFEGSEKLYIPEVDWPHTRSRMLVTERIHGIPISDIPALQAAGIDLKRLAEWGVEIFFSQVFRDNFFHADMHPGNIFVSPEGQYIAVDFGIVGSLSPRDQRYLAENFLAFFRRDYHRVAELHIESGWVPAGTRIDEFESAIRTVCEPIFQRPLKEISFGHLLLRLFQTARRFHMEVQPQLVLLQKTLLNIEGLGRQLYPDLDLWSTAKPFLEHWMSEQIGTRALLRSLRRNAPLWAEKLPELPLLLHDLLEREREGRRTPDHGSRALERLRADLRAAHRRTLLAVTGTGTALAGGYLVLQPHTLPEPVGWGLLGGGVLLLLVTLRSALR